MLTKIFEMLIDNLIREKCIYVKIKCLFTFYYYLKLSQKTRPEKKDFIMKIQNQRSFRTYTQGKKTQQ